MRPPLVHFRIRDCYHPEPRQILDQLHGDDVLQGEVVQVVRGAAAGESDEPVEYLAVTVAGIAELVIVPRRRVTWSIPNGSVR